MKSRKNFIKGIAGFMTLGWLFSDTENAQARDLYNVSPEVNEKDTSLIANPLLGCIMLFAGNFAPDGWMICNGRLLTITSNPALFSIIGTSYGGNGSTNFALPNLSGTAPIGVGQGPGLSNYQLGNRAGSETATLSVANIPSHSHSLRGSSSPGISNAPVGNVPAVNRDGILHYGSEADVDMSSASVTNTGGSQPVSIIQPVLAMTYCIAVQGIFPPRS